MVSGTCRLYRQIHYAMTRIMLLAVNAVRLGIGCVRFFAGNAFQTVLAAIIALAAVAIETTGKQRSPVTV